MSQLYFPSLSPDNQTGDGPASLAELQGALCGLLCMDALADRKNWYVQLFEDFSPAEEEKQDLTHLFDDTIQSLNSLDFDFQIELPDDNAPIVSRLSAMADWCQGLVYGLGTSGMTNETELSDDCQEYVTDVIKISQVNFENVEDTEEERANFEELVEYIRMGLFLLYGELQPADPTDEATEH
ncbi:MAG TPA: hypothetical protein EYM37_04945 [Methylophaga aminisulfidivorans]|jgi:hypothetical protein|uniref:UPF0149 family protein n=1 Tax=Methylophaga TaxID=40222 RepID=UPI001750FB85|nr:MULTISPECIES: UPF0149 family protein [Methylophaga]HIC46669.1 UPF0149 family protein [Methylophaga sp.]HIM39271.1 hypothetical protein [Methylophaga aminisulfidivorans]